MLQEIEESLDDKEKRAEIRSKKHEKWINMEGAEKTGWDTTSGSRNKRATKMDNV